MSKFDLTDDERGFLGLLANYGDSFDATGPRIGQRVKAVGRELVRKGLVSGKPKNYSLTPEGRKLAVEP